jgi:hypothetical protein
MTEPEFGPAPTGRERRGRSWGVFGGAVVFLLVLAACGEAVGEATRAGAPPPAAASDTLTAGVGTPLPGRVALPPVLPPPPPPRVIPEPPPLTGESPGAALETTELPAPVFHRPEHIRGIYLNAWVSGSRARREELIELARRTEVNTFVIDVKDESGYLSYGTRVGLAREIGADRERRIRGIRELLHRLNEEGIYPVARIVIFKDPLLAVTRPDLAVRHRDGKPWVDGKGDLWVNPWAQEVWDYHIELAREAVELGFPEIQWDYIRFPDRPSEEMAQAVFPGSEGRPRTAAVRGFLQRARAELADLEVPLTADVFGLVTTYRNDVGIGQLWEEVIDVTDAVLPMVYPSHYWRGSYGYDEPNDRPYEVVAAALRDAVRRTAGIEGAGRIIPWLQNFTLGPPHYGAPEVRAQILATYDQGIKEWILWNASGRYTEAALEPVGGWPEGREPMIRIAGQVMDAEWRFLPLPAVDLTDDAVEASGRDVQGDQGPRGR